jgi:hypothetical protein
MPNLYPLIRPALRRLPSETAHELTLRALEVGDCWAAPRIPARPPRQKCRLAAFVPGGPLRADRQGPQLPEC